ncbi:ABC transporter ATP-binding protein/permease [Brevibacterium sp. p3-SID960]|uniref:ABC transporter ATP-binding protein n=1 Tax=Brevibacterium sp. p3-SID960 TaxID=2916063 RepID=UPI0021A345CF|nr:ABC transporter ATP-binding protein [Brevibacterium sp. p3-SID960]MCT1690490.1 ABC transporter ATP-binding protein/permease [Brevibacterium sp. p3-SID960]
MTHATARRRELTGWLIGQTRGLLAPLGLAVIARVLGQLLGVALFVFAASLLIRAAGPQLSGQPVGIGVAVAALAGMAIAKALLRYAEHYAGHYVAFTSLQRLRDAFFARLIPQAPAATQGRAGAELTSRATSDIDRIEVFFAHTLPPAVSAVAVPAIALTWLAVVVDPRLALTLTLTVAALLALPLLTRRGAVDSADAVARVRGQIAERLGDDVQGMREILGFGIAEQRLDGLARVDAARTTAAAQVGASQATRAGLSVLLQGGGLIAVLLIGAGVGASPAAIMTALAVGIGLIGPARGFEDYITGLDNAFAATARIREIMDAAPAVTDSASRTAAAAPAATGDPCESEATPGPAAAAPLSGTAAPLSDTPAPPSGTAGSLSGAAGCLSGAAAGIEFDDVTFSYDPNAGPRALGCVTLHAEAGTWTHIVGVSGSGKSTLAGLLLRGWNPESGVVRLAGTDVRELPLAELRSRISLAPQRPTTLRGTLRENLTLAAPDATDEQIAEALMLAGLPDWTERLAEPVGARGQGISGGQLQRLSLARALLPNPQVLIIDEGLSQLDADTAAEVRQRLQAIENLTIIEITHRADLIDDAAAVWVLDLGTVVESGTAGQLRSRTGPFQRLEARMAYDA